jgi:hypothetical protein
MTVLSRLTGKTRIGLSSFLATLTLALLIGETGCSVGISPGGKDVPCDGFRWSIKTGDDTGAVHVNLTPQPTTITAMNELPKPDSLPEGVRIAPTELTTFELKNVTLIKFRLEIDKDIHLVMSDGQNTMITELPSPSCVESTSPFRLQITSMRRAFEETHNVSAAWTTANETVTLIGVGFFDKIAGQTGIAHNGVELHPILCFCSGKDCEPNPAP